MKHANHLTFLFISMMRNQVKQFLFPTIRYKIVPQEITIQKIKQIQLFVFWQKNVIYTITALKY